MLKAAYTREEAELLVGMPMSLSTVDALARQKDIDPGTLQTRLNDLAGRGLVYRQTTNGVSKYRLNPPRFVFLRSFFWPGRRDVYTRGVAPHVTAYWRDGFGDHWKGVKTKGLRAIPVKKTLADTRAIRPYEDILDVLKGQTRFAVAHCPCRGLSHTDPHRSDCRHETENCLHFGKLAAYIVEAGLGREITRSECEDILKKAARAGLVHAISNWQENVDTICNCCQCCCVYFQAFHALGHDESMSPSNHEVRTDPQTCVGCGKCVERCPMDALSLKSHPLATGKNGNVSSLRRERCIGCGVCAYGCPTQALRLAPRQDAVDPPATVLELKERYRRERSAAMVLNGRHPASAGACEGDISSGESILED